MKQQSRTGVLYLIPAPLSAGALHTLPSQTIEVLHATKYFIVENARTARRFISSTKPPHPIDRLMITELDKYAPPDIDQMLIPLYDGHDVGILSEAGCPGIADPGAALVRAAHAKGLRVIPLAGPSSILLALIASGMDGQRFQFHGYLSQKKEDLAKDLRRLETLSRKEQATQIFIETPYRNRQVIDTALAVLAPQTLLCVAVDLTAETEWIRTMSVAAWKTAVPDLHKRPTVFCLFVEAKG